MVIALFVALIGPYFIDWTAYKKDFENQASRIIGQAVTVSGEAEVRLLPQPSVSFTNVSVGRNSDGSPMLAMKRFSANVELMPFLSGEVQIIDMTLDAPKFDIEIDENGKIAWTDRQQALVDPGQVQLDRLIVRNGSFTLSGLASGRDVAGSQINAELSARSFLGPWRIDGTGLVDGKETGFQISTGTYSQDNPLRLKVTASRSDQPYTLAADGQVTLTGEVLNWSGTFNIDPAADTVTSSPAIDMPKALPVAVEGDFLLTPTTLQIPKYRTEIGKGDDPFVLTGSGRANLRGGVDFQLEVDGRQIDVERIAKMQGGEAASAETLETRIAVLRGVVDRIPVPDLKGEIDLEIPAIIAGDTFIREISALVRPYGNSWEIVRLKTRLPGNTLVEASGRLGIREDFGFHGRLLLASRQPSGFAAWAAGEVDPSIRQLSLAGFSADVTLTANQTSLDQLELFLNRNKLTGSINRVAPVGSLDAVSGRPAIVANLQGDQISLDHLRALASLVVGGKGNEMDRVALSHDFDVRLKTDLFSGFDVEATGVETQFQYRNGALSIAQLNVEDFFGVSLQSKGRVADLLGAAQGNLALTLSAPTLAKLATFVGERLGSNQVLESLATDPLLSKDTLIEFEFDSSALANAADQTGEAGSRSRIIMTGETGGTKINVRSGFRGNLSDPQTSNSDVSVDLMATDSGKLAAQLGLRALGFTDLYVSLPGPAKVSIESAGDMDQGHSMLVNAELPGTVLSAKGNLRSAKDSQSDSVFEITAGSDNVAPLVAAFGYLPPGLNGVLGDEVPASFNGTLTLNAGEQLKIDIRKASLGSNPVSGSLAFSDLAMDPAAIEGTLEMRQLDLAILASGLMGFDPGLIATGGFVDAGEATFGGPLFGELAGNLTLKAEEFDAGIRQKGEQVTMELALRPAKTEITGLEMQWLGGTLKGSGTLGHSEGAVTVNGQYTFEGGDMPGFLEATGSPPIALGELSASGTLEMSARSPQALVKSLSGNGVVTYGDAALLGVSNDGLPGLLEAVDEEGFVISSETLRPLVESAFLNERLPIGSGSFPYAFRNGGLRLRNLPLTDESGNSSGPALADLTYDIATDAVSASLRLVPEAGKQAVEGATPEVTFTWSGDMSAPQALIDTTGLEGYLSIRAFEAEQRRVELLQASILEKQRFRRDLLNSGERGRWLQAKRIAELKRQEEARKAAEEAARLEAERLAKEEAERKAREAAQALARQQEAERLLAEKAAAEAAEKARLAEEIARDKQREIERLAVEQAASEQRTARQPVTRTNGTDKDDFPKKDFEINPLPSLDSGETAPSGNTQVPRSLFENIEKLLFQPNEQ